MTIITQVFYLISEFISAPGIRYASTMIISYFASPTQGIIISVFIYYGNKIVCNILIGFLLIFTSNIVEVVEDSIYEVKAEVARVILVKLSYVVRIIALLFVIVLREKSDSRCEDGAITGVYDQNIATTLV
ncbi:hypothetical protein BDF19DRAFT_446604 [Syncephalis fuscata]|nr:hypothetical protein BDF19DRAFT_446604 [Syncephalis fuscata]